MKTKALFALLIILSMLITSVSFAESGEIVPSSDGVMHRRNISHTPDLETERANLNHMSFYVPVQSSSGELLAGVEYYTDDGTDDGALFETRNYAKPLVAVYIDSQDHEEELGSGGAGIGAHDAHAAVSLDDGATWKRTNLSNSAHLSSFTLEDGTVFPGDAHNMTFAIAGDKVLVGWISRYCDGGLPLYTFDDEEILALQTAFGLPDLYVRDIWGVAGTQKSVNYTLQGYPDVGEIPYSCVWSARGQLVALGEDGIPDLEGDFHDIIWTKAERLTSGRRDANRLELNGDSAAGFMMTWQEDPEGLRPGQGLGPGEGWSGAVVNQQTDLWYSFISIGDFDKVSDADEAGEDIVVPLAEFTGDEVPKIAVPMAMPIRLTDNAKCMFNETSDSLPYCYVDFDDVDPYGATVLEIDAEGEVLFEQSSTSTFCKTDAQWLPPGGSTSISLCQAEDGRVLGGRVGASRPRVNVQPYNSAFVVSDETYDGGIVIMGAEESKALGEGSTELDIEPEDIGKNMWYYSFDLTHPGFVMQGGMLNQPAKCTPFDAGDTAKCPAGEGEFYKLLVDDFGNEFYETEIARRFSHFSQPIHQFGATGVSSVLIVKQGIINQGGPADIFLRMTQVPDDVVWEACALDDDNVVDDWCLPEGYNPYAYQNLACAEWANWSSSAVSYENDVNPRYIEGLCLDNMINVSGTSIVECDGDVGGEACVDAFPWEGAYAGEDNGTDDGGDGDALAEEPTSSFPKVVQWSQSGPDFGMTITDPALTNLDDQSWENPYDVAKGHRGFIDGDFIMMMYAWSPNWKANSVGNDHYNLYARRSFDGGQTWTTLPASYTHVDGSTWTGNNDVETCENYLNDADGCTTYTAGAFEQARNLSQLTGNKVTILDPRYSPTGGIKMLPVTDKLGVDGTGGVTDSLPYWDDAFRDPSKFFIVYETGDNTTVAEGEAVPMDLFFSRATSFGDYYDLAEYPLLDADGAPVLAFDWLEHDHEDLSGEAANTANNGGTFYYTIWNQWQEDEHENVSNSDAMFRRLMWVDDETAATRDFLPISSIIYQSTDMADYETEVVLVGSARDIDTMNNADATDDGIAEAKWKDDLTGLEWNERTWKFIPQGWKPGKHPFSFHAKDNEGNSSTPKTVTIWIAEKFYNIYLPTVSH